jgi:hypothetical protein
MKTYQGYITKLEDNQVFVFGSNLQGFHGAGSAGFASFGVTGNKWRQFDYAEKPSGWKGKWNVKGVGTGFQEGEEGKSYALPTVKRAGDKLSLSKTIIISNIHDLYDFASAHPDYEFFIAYRDDGAKLLNGYTVVEMAEMFSSLPIPENVIFEEEFSKLLKI